MLARMIERPNMTRAANAICRARARCGLMLKSLIPSPPRRTSNMFNPRILPSVVLLLILARGTASGQNAAATIARAQSTLNEIERLLARIIARQAGGQTATSAAGDWQNLFDGKSLAGWMRTGFAGAGEVHVETSFRGGP